MNTLMPNELICPSIIQSRIKMNQRIYVPVVVVINGVVVLGCFVVGSTHISSVSLQVWFGHRTWVPGHGSVKRYIEHDCL